MEGGHYPTSVLVSEMLNLIYSGNAGSAWKLVDEAWGPDPHDKMRFADKEEFVREFRAWPPMSHYWPDIRAMSGK